MCDLIVEAIIRCINTDKNPRLIVFTCQQ